MVKKISTGDKVLLNTAKKTLTDDQFRIARKEINGGAVPMTEIESQQIIDSKKNDREKLVMDLAVASMYLNWAKKEIKCVQNTIEWFKSRRGILPNDILVRNQEGIALDQEYFIGMYHHKIVLFKKLVTQFKWDLDAAKAAYGIVPAEVDLKMNDMLTGKSPDGEDAPKAD